MTQMKHTIRIRYHRSNVAE